eukprot:9798438-Heterocapsa_arctica.AAC.1
MELHSYKGWVPHAFIYAWINANGKMEMTPEVFWNIVLYTKGNRDKEHSYRVNYWPMMQMAFIKVERTARQEAQQAERAEDQKRRRGQQEDYGKWNRDNDWSGKGQHYQVKASSSNARDTEDGWKDNKWKEQSGWMDYEQDNQEERSPEYDGERKMIVQA